MGSGGESTHTHAKEPLSIQILPAHIPHKYMGKTLILIPSPSGHAQLLESSQLRHHRVKISIFVDICVKKIKSWLFMYSGVVYFAAMSNGLGQTIVQIAEVVSSLTVTVFFCPQMGMARVQVEAGVGLI